MQKKSLRPDPDALLKEAEREDVKKGRLKIFLGYAPGVGKTYAMLNDAHVLKKRGVDVVVGFVETHKRPETEALLIGLEVLPTKKIDYKGIVLEEMDIDTILARKPAMVLVDEFAHTNAEGSRHPKRYQDIEELLENGIDVHTTVNIQHFESMNDSVAKITGVRMQETIPDTLFDRADEVQVIDIPWEELNQRLKEGKVYIPQQARHAIDNFFQRGNLFALRELMLTLVARKMDSDLLNYMKAKAIPGPWPTAEKLIVCVGPSPYAKQLIRKAYTIAKDTHAEWYAVYVLSTGLTEPSGRDKVYLTDALNLAEELGAKIITLTGNDIADEILRFAREKNVTRIVIGKPLRSMPVEFFKGSPVSRLLYAHSEFEIHLINPTTETKDKEHTAPPRRLSFKLSNYLISSAMVLIVTLINALLQRFIEPSSFVYLYLIATITSALLYGMGPSIFASGLSLLVLITSLHPHQPADCRAAVSGPLHRKGRVRHPGDGRSVQGRRPAPSRIPARYGLFHPHPLASGKEQQTRGNHQRGSHRGSYRGSHWGSYRGSPSPPAGHVRKYEADRNATGPGLETRRLFPQRLSPAGSGGRADRDDHLGQTSQQQATVSPYRERKAPADHARSRGRRVMNTLDPTHTTQPQGSGHGL